MVFRRSLNLAVNTSVNILSSCVCNFNTLNSYQKILQKGLKDLVDFFFSSWFRAS